MDIIKSMNNDIEKNMVILHIDNYVISQKEDDFFDGFILCNFEYDEVIIRDDVYEDFNDVDILIPSSSFPSINVCDVKPQETAVLPQEWTESTFLSEEGEEEKDKEAEVLPETMTSSTSSLDTEEEQELETQLMYYKTSIESI